jgi:hypothetical protein
MENRGVKRRAFDAPVGGSVGTFLQSAATRYIAIFIRLEEPYNLPKYDRHYNTEGVLRLTPSVK